MGEAKQPDVVVSGDRPFRLTQRTRGVIAFLAITLAVVNQFWFKLDLVSLGLLGFALLVLFIHITKVDLWGMVQGTMEETEKVEKVRLPEAPEEPPPEPEVTVGERIAVADRATVELTPPLPLHREASDLLPPSDPGERILWATSKIANELVILAGNSGQEQVIKGLEAFPRLTKVIPFASLLAERKIIPGDLLGPMKALFDWRNALVHGKISIQQAQTVIPLADLIMVKLQQIERYYYRVGLSHVELYKDREATALYGIHGVMIVTLDNEGIVVRQSAVRPRVRDYKTGRFVTWEWDMSRTFTEEAWYRDPEDQTPKMAFRSSAAFAGREYPEQWGIEYRFPRPDVGLQQPT
jgi:hypothetical protein